MAVSYREQKARRIRELMQTWAENTIHLGLELKEARETFPLADARGAVARRPGWADWLANEVGFTQPHANALIRVAEHFGGEEGAAFPVSASFRVLEFLARDNVPDEGRQEVVDRIKSGETIGKGRARAMRRAGELLKQIEPGQGARDGKREDGDGRPLRSDIARQAGMSERQQKTAVRVANVPADDFDRQVESKNPPTLTTLADCLRIITRAEMRMANELDNVPSAQGRNLPNVQASDERASYEEMGLDRRRVSEGLGVDDKTVGVVRRDMEATAEIPQLEKTVGAPSGKGRKFAPFRRS